MPSSGSHTGSAIPAGPAGISSDILCPGIPETYLSLEGYWEFLQINECAGYGIRNYPTTGFIGMGCGDYWDQRERVFLAYAIQKAEARLEADRWLGFPIRRKYYSARQLPYSFPFLLGKHVRGIGVETNTVIEEGKLLSLRSGVNILDPVTFTINVTFTDPDELVIYYPNTTDCTIRPSSITISSGVATVKIPRCRLLKPEYFKDYADVNDRPNYEDDSYFLTEVDVYRNYLDTSTGANLVWWRHAGSLSCLTDVFCSYEPSGACADIRQLACPYVSNQRDGIVQLEPASYSGGWTKQSYAVSRCPDGIEINYMRGYYDRYDEIRADLKRVIIAMAHNNMPQDYCTCSVQTHYYKRDTRPLEPPVRLGLGESTWGHYEAEQIIREFDKDRYPYAGGLL